jgi:hypothetical protein
MMKALAISMVVRGGVALSAFGSFGTGRAPRVPHHGNGSRQAAAHLLPKRSPILVLVSALTLSGITTLALTIALILAVRLIATLLLASGRAIPIGLTALSVLLLASALTLAALLIVLIISLTGILICLLSHGDSFEGIRGPPRGVANLMLGDGELGS